MRRIIRPTDCVLALCGLFLWAPIASEQTAALDRARRSKPQSLMSKLMFALVLASCCVAWPRAAFADTYWYCQFVPRNNPKLTYFSDTFGPLEEGAHSHSLQNTTGHQLMKAFAAYLSEKYSEKDGFPGCAKFNSEDEAKAGLKRDEGIVQKNNGKFVATGWRYMGASDPPNATNAVRPPTGATTAAGSTTPQTTPADVSAAQAGQQEGAAAPSPVAGGAPQAQSAQAQYTPSAGTSVAVRMIDAVDSSSDPAGKQYRATVTKPVNVGNNVIIGQGSVATVTLARNDSGWVAQLSSLAINNQVVAVTSSSASVTGSAQNRSASAANTVGSVLGGFGRRTNTAATIAAVASGQRVVLPPGISLTFVLGATPPSSSTAPAPSPSAGGAAPGAPSAQSTAKAENSSTGLFKGYCFTPRNHPVIYVSGIFQTNIRDTGKIQDAFLEYLKQKYSYKSTDLYPAGCPLNASAAYIEENKRTLEAEWRRGNIQIVETGWKYVSTPNAAAGQAATSGPAPTTQTPQAQDPRLAQIPQDRQFALNEVPRSENYCQNNAFLSGLMDCSCFAQIVLDYRIAHAGETVRVPIINVIGAGKLDCSKCLPEDRLTKWAVEQSRTGIVGASPAQAKRFSDCVARTLVKSFKPQPYVYMVQGLYNQAVVACNR